jgi:hypothetical protein
LASFRYLGSLAPISKCFAKRAFQTICVCPLKKFKKSGFLQIGFSKSGFCEKPIFKASSKYFTRLQRIFGFKNLGPTSKESLFSNENYFKLLPYLARWILFHKENSFQNCLLIQKLLSKEK